MALVRITQTNGEKRIIGRFSAKTKEFISKRKKSLHFYRKLNSWGIDTKAFEGLIEQGLEKVIIIEERSGDRYVAGVETIQEHGKYLHHKPHRAQIFLEEKYWEVE